MLVLLCAAALLSTVSVDGPAKDYAKVVNASDAPVRQVQDFIQWNSILHTYYLLYFAKSKACRKFFKRTTSARVGGSYWILWWQISERGSVLNSLKPSWVRRHLLPMTDNTKASGCGLLSASLCLPWLFACIARATLLRQTTECHPDRTLLSASV